MASLKNEIGNEYGYLTVIARAENDKSGRAKWLCKCKCGNQVEVLGKSLRNGNTKSCGCLQRERAAQSNMARVENIIGKRFGRLTVVEEIGFFTHKSGKKSRIYKCKCDCGNYCEVQHQYLTFGDTTSCGCIRSKGEFQIAQLLTQNGYDFVREYSFDDLKDQYVLRFDFAIFKNNQLVGLIEYQGEQHFCPSNGFYSEDLIRHDKMKVEYCQNKNIPLIIIYYKKNYNLTLADLQIEKLKEIKE